jgi:hypothetical protein
MARTNVFAPTPITRLLGLVGVIGGSLLLWAFISFEPFEERTANTVRLLLFVLGGAAVALAFYGRLAPAAPRLTLAITGAVVFAAAAYAAWLLLALGIERAFQGTFGALNFIANIALWLSAALYGAGLLWTRAAWRGMTRWPALATKVGAILLLGSMFGWLGDDRLGLVDAEPFGAIWSAVALFGVALNGAGWIALGAVLLLGGGGGRGTHEPV